jgi:hypothetical protein
VARQWEAAEDHLQIAMQQAESFLTASNKRMRCFHAIVLIGRAA